MDNIFENVKMIGIGKGGSQLVSRLSSTTFSKIKAVGISTNEDDLNALPLKEKILILINSNDTKSQINAIRKSIYGYSCIFIFAQFGEDNSSHLAAAIAKISTEMNITNIAICSTTQKLDNYSKVSMSRLKENCKNILWLPNNLTVGEIFNQSDILQSLEYVKTLPEQPKAPVRTQKTILSKFIGKKVEDNSPVITNSGEILTQDEFSFTSLAEQRGFFENTPRNIYNGEDLDIPTYLRKNLKINL